MVPGTWLSVVLFLLFVAPGLVFDLLAARRRVEPDESAFREISRMILASPLFSGLALGILSIIRGIQPAWMPDVGRLFSDGDAYMDIHYRLVLRTLVIEACIAVTLALAAHVLIASRRGGATLRPVSPWQRAFRDDCPPGSVPHVRLRLSNDLIYTGRVGDFTADRELVDREIVLVPPLTSRSAPEKPFGAVPKDWQRVIIPAHEIKVMSVAYRPRPSGEDYNDLWWRRLKA